MRPGFSLLSSLRACAGDESNVMMDAHSNAGFVVGTPFSNPGLYDFASHSSLTKQVGVPHHILNFKCFPACTAAVACLCRMSRPS